MNLRGLTSGLLIVAVATTAAAQQQTQVDLTSIFNDQLTGGGYCCSSAAYPTSGALTNLGVTFSMASRPDVSGGAPFDAWRGEFAPGRMFELAIGMTGVRAVYTLMQTRFGYPGDPSDLTTAQASLTFNYAGGGSFTEYLFGCFNIRDHNPFGYSAGCWPADSPAPAGSNAAQFASFNNGDGQVDFDMQTYDVLPSYWDQELVSIDFIDYGPAESTPFLRGVTIESTPEPSTWILVASGFMAVAGVARRRKHG